MCVGLKEKGWGWDAPSLLQTLLPAVCCRTWGSTWEIRPFWCKLSSSLGCTVLSALGFHSQPLGLDHSSSSRPRGPGICAFVRGAIRQASSSSNPQRGQLPKPPTGSILPESRLGARGAGWAGAGLAGAGQGRVKWQQDLQPAASSAKPEPDPCWASVPLCSRLRGRAVVNRARRPRWSYYPCPELLQVLGTTVVFSTVTVKEVTLRAVELSIPGSSGERTLRYWKPELGQPHACACPWAGGLQRPLAPRRWQPCSAGARTAPTRSPQPFARAGGELGQLLLRLVCVDVVWGQAWPLAAERAVSPGRGAVKAPSRQPPRQQTACPAPGTSGAWAGCPQRWHAGASRGGLKPDCKKPVHAQTFSRSRGRGVFGELQVPKRVTSEERDYLYNCTSWEQQVGSPVHALPPLTFTRMSSESLFRNRFVQLLLVSEELKRVYFKKAKALIPGKRFFFPLGKSNCCCRPLRCRGGRLAAANPSPKTGGGELPTPARLGVACL